MPMLTTFLMRRPVWPVHAPPRTSLANAVMWSRTACTSGTTFRPSTMTEAPRGARSATWSTDRFSVTLIFSPPNIASIRSRSRDSSASRARRVIVSSVTRCFE